MWSALGQFHEDVGLAAYPEVGLCSSENVGIRVMVQRIKKYTTGSSYG